MLLVIRDAKTGTLAQFSPPVYILFKPKLGIATVWKSPCFPVFMFSTFSMPEHGHVH